MERDLVKLDALCESCWCAVKRARRMPYESAAARARLAEEQRWRTAIAEAYGETANPDAHAALTRVIGLMRSRAKERARRKR